MSGRSEGTPRVAWLLHSARKRLGLSLTESGRRAGLTGATWANYEPGPTGDRYRSRNGMKPHTIAKMARVVDLTPDDLRAAGRGDAAAAYLAMWPPERDRRDDPAELRELSDAWPKLDAAGRAQMLAQLRMSRDWAHERLRLQSTMPRQFDLFSEPA
jgi:transcriptional regulator with XRE-family HTH domain